ncbi:MBL fold metallo-hydrolase [bacterium]|nr:MBL fold metallo-hydrolase [bacterium]
MLIQFLGGAMEVTGSTHVLSTKKSRVLRDAGLFQGRRAETREKNETIFTDMEMVDSMVLSHAHIDHCGNIPLLVKRGYTGPIHTHAATKDLCELMLLDSAHIQELDAEYLSRKLDPDDPLIAPLYSEEEAEASLGTLVPHQYHEHIQLTDIDALVMEATYGNRYHKDINQAEDLLAGVVNRTFRRGGKIIIPAFALERAQEIVYTLMKRYEAKLTPMLPIYIDSPLACEVSKVFGRHPETYDEATLQLAKSRTRMYMSEFVHLISSVEESKALNDDPSSMIIISASGMCESGRILHHLKNNVEDPRNAVVIVGYQAENTLGRRIVERATELKIFGQFYKMNAERVVLNTFSGHADKGDLLHFVSNVGERCKTFVLVHGEKQSILDLADSIRALRPDARVLTPERFDTISI